MQNTHNVGTADTHSRRVLARASRLAQNGETDLSNALEAALADETIDGDLRPAVEALCDRRLEAAAPGGTASIALLNAIDWADGRLPDEIADYFERAAAVARTAAMTAAAYAALRIEAQIRADELALAWDAVPTAGLPAGSAN